MLGKGGIEVVAGDEGLGLKALRVLNVAIGQGGGALQEWEEVVQ
jgi:hypothetical protein